MDVRRQEKYVNLHATSLAVNALHDTLADIHDGDEQQCAESG